MRRLSALALVLLLGAAFARPQVVVTIHPWADLTAQIAGGLADVHQLLPAGVSPHSFDPAPRDVMRVADADLVISNGGVGLDDWVQRLIAASGTDARQLVVMDSISFSPLGAGGRPSAEGEFVNAHIWLDVTIAMSAAEVIGNTLSELDPDNAAAYRANTEALLGDLADLDRELLETLEPVRGAAFVPFHDAWPYFANRYGLDLVVEIEPFPGREPSPDYIRQALELIRGSGARALFSERQLSPRPAEVVAAEAGLPVYVLDPEGGGSEAVETFQQLLRFNAAVLLDALAD